VAWKSNKQAVISRSNASDCRAMADAIYELPWIQDLVNEHHLLPSSLVLYCDNKATFILQRIMILMSAPSISRWIIILSIKR